MAERERVRKAIEAPVNEAAKLLDESPRDDVEARLAMLIDGWGRGLAAGLEELAIAVADLRWAPPVEGATPPSAPRPAKEPETRNRESRESDDEARTEDELLAEAQRSREKTEELRADQPGDGA